MQDYCLLNFKVKQPVASISDKQLFLISRFNP